MLKTFLKGAMLATSLTMAGGVFASVAQAQTYNRGNDTDPTTLDHQKTSTVAEGHIMRDLQEGLVAFGPKAEIVPGAAESWEISEDGLVYTFKLREDGKWSNGEPVTAEDFVFTFQRIQDPATAAPYANMHYIIKNAEKLNKGEVDKAELGVKAIDERTLEITLNEPTPYFLGLLTHQTGLPVNKKSVEEHGEAFSRPGNLVSNGAFMLESFVPNDKIVLKKNPHYHAADEVKLETVNIIPFEDRAACLRRFEAGEIHTCSDLAAEQMDYMKQNLGDQVRIAPYLGTYYLPVKGKEGSPLKDKRVRRALSLVIDRDFLAKDIWRDTMLPGYSMVPPGIDNYNDPVFLEFKEDDLLDREDEAKRLLEEAGIKEGELTVELRYNTSENHKNTMTAVGDMFKNIGVNATYVEMEGTGYFNYMKNDGAFDISRAGWIGDYSDPQNFLFLFETDNLGFNYPRWSNAEYDKLMAEAAKETDLAARSKILAQAETILLDEEPAIPVLYYASGSLVSNKVSGWEDNLQNAHRARYISIAE
ncbi:peptide ABC transporter substrate-binding protein [Limoniibacter endophyticus]|uniref:ABC transporter substrate-binding protein n=1 Tax=Limoniibacter endophyticus TaxID=1565040 RepID=A0A8J3GH91_9HYPH|nr:peptide ABC transporter substrate-binding protein [Limoniibacter endophyticus]GHC69763.1 ABC transporter substrate-binding protein [Limoniibacter endophyticus]